MNFKKQFKTSGTFNDNCYKLLYRKTKINIQVNDFTIQFDEQKVPTVNF